MHPRFFYSGFSFSESSFGEGTGFFVLIEFHFGENSSYPIVILRQLQDAWW